MNKKERKKKRKSERHSQAHVLDSEKMVNGQSRKEMGTGRWGPRIGVHGVK